MIQNLRVDTIYYVTNSDFEMEFNLCGCCKMRLLTDKAENPKNFVGLLSRAVSRSQVIICCGKLFGNDGLINIVSQTIKKPLTKIDNAEYGIADSNEIKIVGDSVPLVNSDGCFCGCISESGPQSIILLTDNKGIRKTVMKQLIHPYIEELSILKNTEKSETPTEEVTDENENLIVEENDAENETIEENSDNDTLDENTDEIIEENPEDLLILEDSSEENASENVSQNGDAEVNISEDSDTSDESKETDEPIAIPAYIVPDNTVDGFDFYFEEHPDRSIIKKHANAAYASYEEDNVFITNDFEPEFFQNKSALNISILIIAIVLLCALAALAYLLVFIPMSSNYVFSEYIKNIFSVSVNIKPLL